MTLSELKNRFISKHIAYAYGGFKEITEPPHVVAIGNGTENFYADNITYKKIQEIELVYTYIDKDEDMENKIENEILADIDWKKDEEKFLSDEKVWQVSYFIKL